MYSNLIQLSHFDERGGSLLVMKKNVCILTIVEARDIFTEKIIRQIANIWTGSQNNWKILNFVHFGCLNSKIIIIIQ